MSHGEATDSANDVGVESTNWTTSYGQGNCSGNPQGFIAMSASAPWYSLLFCRLEELTKSTISSSEDVFNQI